MACVGGSCFPPAVCMSLCSYNVDSLDPPGKFTRPAPGKPITYVLLLLIVSSSIELVVVGLVACVVGGSCFPRAVCMSLRSYNIDSLDPPVKPLTYVLLPLIVSSSIE